MDIQRQFPGVHWVWRGGISFVYEVHPLIVVKVPKSGQEEREKFRKELKIYEILSRHLPCPSLVQCFHYTTDGIFLEYMRGAIPFGDNSILLATTKVVLDFDCTAEFGTDFETCPCPHGRLLNNKEADQGLPGTASLLGTRTELFALGSLYYLINYGFGVYDDQRLADDPYEHGPRVVDLLQDMEFPKLDGDPLIDDIIDKCWHNQYRTLADLATHTETLLKQPRSEALNHKATSPPGWRTDIGRILHQLWYSPGAQRRSNGEVANGDDYYKVDQKHPGEHLSSKQEFCPGLEKRGLLRLLASSKPMELGFNMEHRHVSSTTSAN
ncbi:serine/threonine protein kinase [Penicillium paradoxum]|uniref:serine/threonine protein kinase n=1 Tax=Penicillium paradoxum TaxID=176176 RepID=UPI002546F13E|nr:serine/threonine protein kinase [Penicillium paradoxum]KAJ5787127.1 serine/threonine protein kinase [Penicillium paradoxum]